MDFSSWSQATAFSGSLIIAIPVAAAAGLASFFSPCVVPLLPGYLSYATGLSGTDLESGHRGRAGAGATLFVLGFSLVFLSFGALFGQTGRWLFEYRSTINVVLGLMTVLVGLAFMGLVPLMQGDYRLHRVPATGLVAAPFLGVIFGLGWSPCIGPTLTAVMSLASNEASAGRGAVLSLAYCLGLGIPFIAAGVFLPRMLGVIAWVRVHNQWITRAGGGMLVIVGVLLVSGLWDQWVGELRYWVADTPALF